ncbi:MAG: ABC transporter ATP-binding protein/permease [Lactobacillaceae bacterium]|jgi:ATP-binding cassette subfamily B protein|nr:ABC transporter ATP-binding protein/permease [Lactobacillaceae bacterium]
MAQSENESVWSKQLSTKEQTRIVWELMKFAKPFRKMFFGATFFALVVSSINVILPHVLQIFMNNYLSNESTTMQTLIVFAAIYFAITVVKAIGTFFDYFWFTMGAEYMLERVRVILFTKLHTLGMRYFDQTPAGSLVSRVTNDTASFNEFWMLFQQLSMAALSVITAFIAMWLTDVKIMLVALIFVPILLGVIWAYQRFATKVYRRMRERLSALNAKLAESITGMSVIQQFRQEERIDTEFDDINNQYYDARVRMVKTNSLMLSPAIDLMYGAAIVIVLFMFGLKSQHSIVAAGTVYAFLSYVAAFYNPMDAAMDFLSSFQDGVVSGSRVLTILNDDTLAPMQNVGAAGEITTGKIEFKNVSFSYDGKHEVLKNLSFVAEAGQTVALVGHTGSGKSSTINTLMRFYDFQKGQILIDEQDIRDIKMSDLRQQMGLVLQDPFLFYGDIASNIRMYDPAITDAQIEAAAEFVHADEFINELPQRYHEPVIEKGAAFSSGQRQLISFARTIVRNPKVLVLDEATANVDTETESVIQKSLTKMRENRTTIAIAHRLSTIKDADLILVLDKGEVVERGTHDELLALDGRYADLYKMQTGMLG